MDNDEYFYDVESHFNNSDMDNDEYFYDVESHFSNSDMDNDEYFYDVESHFSNSDSESQGSESDNWSEKGSDDEDAFEQRVTKCVWTPEAELQESIDPKRRARRRAALTVLARTQAKEICLKYETYAAGQLLPGIDNDITMALIAPKLSWRDFHKLSSLSRGWCHAFQSRQIYDARRRSHSKETLVLLEIMQDENSDDILVYSMRDNSCYELPIPYLDAEFDDPFPYIDGGIPHFSQFISLDGKLYILGGHVRSTSDDFKASWNVHVWDLYGQRQWKRCAHMQKGRGDFGCGVMDGKIYVFGGVAPNGSYVYGSEVYDPKNDTWSPIEPMKSLRFSHNVAAVGEQLVAYSGKVVDPNYFDWEGMQMEVDYRTNLFFKLFADSLEVYHPGRNEWREVKRWRAMGPEPTCLRTEFVTQGKVHLLTSEAIYTYDVDRDEWRKVQSCSFSVLQSWYPGAYIYDEVEEEYTPRFIMGPVDTLVILPSAVEVVDDELLAIVHWSIRDSPNPFVASGFFQSKGFGLENEEVVWEKAPITYEEEGGYVMSPIQV